MARVDFNTFIQTSSCSCCVGARTSAHPYEAVSTRVGFY
jgi:hypothetical protein